MTRTSLIAALFLVFSACGPNNPGDDGDAGGRPDGSVNVPDADPLAPDADPTRPDAFIPGDDPNEPNDTIGTATEVTLGTPISGSLGSTGDYDCFEIRNVAARQVIVARVQDGATNKCALDTLDSFIDLRDSANALIAQNDDDDVAKCSRITYRVQAAGDYYICFRLPEDVLTLYDYSLLVRVITPAITAESEDNDLGTIADPFVAADGALFTGEYTGPYPPPDRDYFTFSVTGTKRFRIETVGDGDDNCGLVADSNSINNTVQLWNSATADTSDPPVMGSSTGGVYDCGAIEYGFAAGTYWISSWPSDPSAGAILPTTYGILFLEEAAE